MGSFSLSGGVEVFGFISPSDTTDVYPVIDPLYGIDGLRNVNNLTELNNIPNLRRRAGMIVGVSGGTIFYKLNPSPWSGTITDWSLFSLGSDFTGGTVTGSTIFTNGLSANTISATTYLNLPIDVFVTGGTFSGGDIIFTNNTGGTFNVSGISSFDTFVTGFSYNDNTFTISQNSGSSFSTTIDIVTGLTINGDLNVTGVTYTDTLSATTYQNLPIDVFVTGGTFSGGVITLVNNTGGTFNISGISSFDTFVTGFTYLNNTFTIEQNSGSSFTATINNVTGLTINGDLIVTGSSTLDGVISSQSLSGATDRIVQVNSGGTLTATTEVIDAYISSASTVASQLSNVFNWDINGNYTGSTITGTFQGQKYYDNNYFFEAVQDNLFIRLIRG